MLPVFYAPVDQGPPAQVTQAPAPNYEQQFEQARNAANHGQPAMAVELYTNLLAASPANVDVLYGRGLAYSRMQQWDEAEKDFIAATDAAPGYADVWLSLAGMYERTGCPAKAVAAYDRVIALRSNDPAPYVARAKAYRDAGQPGLARADLDQAAELNGDRQAIAAARASLQPEAAVPALAALAAPGAVAPAGFDWQASLSGASTRVDPLGQRWADQAFAVRRYWERGSLAFETLRTHRFSNHDTAWALDGYANLWRGAYANVRYQQAPQQRLFPHRAWRAELYQDVGGGWELSASGDTMLFASRADIYGVGIGKYIGNYYLLLRHTNVLTAASHGTGDRLLGRYYYRGDGDSYVELAHSRGRSDDTLSLVGGRTHSGGTTINWVHYVTPHWGAKLGASYARESGGGREKGISVALYRRW
jgi:YaiO family outer membrane protein